MPALSNILRISARTLLPTLAPLWLLTATAWAAPPTRPQLQITGYVISADLDPAVNRLTATADVTFTALDDLTVATFELNNGLQLTKATDAKNQPLESERLTGNSTVRQGLSWVTEVDFTDVSDGSAEVPSFDCVELLKVAVV